MASVTLEGVSKVFPGGVRAVDGIDLQVADQELLVLVGPSGCGKTTTLRMIAGLDEASEGTIRIGPRVVNAVPPKDRNIAMVFQNYALYPHMTVYKNMAFGLHLRYGGHWFHRIWWRLTDPAKARRMAERRRGIRQRVRQAARLLGIEHLLDRMPRQLSGGERQRVALGRAIVREPAAFLFDEPLSNLDAQLRVEMRRELKRLHQQLQATMIYVTHDQVEALTLGQRIAVMQQGRVHQVGPPMVVYDRPKNRFVASFLGTPPMNFIEGRLQAAGGQLQFVADGLQLALAPAADGNRFARLGPQGERPVVLGVRPEHLRHDPASGNRAVVDDVERLGDAAIVQLRLVDADQRSADQPHWLLMKTQPRTALTPGDRVPVSVDPARVHLFDRETGDNLTLTESNLA